MFDTLVAAQGPAMHRRARRALISASVVVHAAALAAVMVMAWWNVDKLEVEDPPVRAYVAIPGSPPPAGSPGQVLPEPIKRPEKVKTTPKDTVQPEQTTTELATTSAAATPGTGDPNGQGGEGPPDGTGTGECTDPSCIGTEPEKKDPPPVEEKKKEPIVTPPPLLPPNVGKGLRVSGNDQIHAPDPVRTQMLREGKDKVTGVVKVCLDTRGRVSSASMAKSTDYAAYDREILDEVRGWTYRPYTVDGAAVRYCTTVTFVYKIRR